MQNAIKKAIEGGWKARWLNAEFRRVGISNAHFYSPQLDRGVSMPLSTIHLDPLFWSSLGKALGWKVGCPNCGGSIGDNHQEMRAVMPFHCYGICGKNFEKMPVEKWTQEWYRFIDHLIAGKDPEEFFETLIKETPAS